MRIKIDKADQLFSRYIRTRDHWACMRCHAVYPPYPDPKSQGLHNSHFFGRKNESTRFDPMNCDALCYGCHSYFTQHPNQYQTWKLRQLGQRMFDILVLRKNTYKKKDRKMEEMIWKKALEDLESERR